jgi:hypothetical protein
MHNLEKPWDNCPSLSTIVSHVGMIEKQFAVRTKKSLGVGRAGSGFSAV